MAKQVKVKTVSNLSNNAFLGLLFIVLGIFFIDNPHSTALQGAVCSYGRK